MLFHSPMSRMNRTSPDALDGEIEPNTASSRSHHGAMTSDEERRHTRARPRPGWPAAPCCPRREPPAPAIDPRARRRRARRARAGRRSATASRSRPAGRPATNDRGVSVQAAGAHPERRQPPAADTARSCPAGPCRSATATGSPRGSPAPIAMAPARPASRATAQVSGAAVAPIKRERQCRRPRRRRRRPPEGDLDERRERHPVGVRGDRQHRVRREVTADLGEDPDQVDAESVAGHERSGHVDVIEGIRVGRVRKVRRSAPVGRPGRARTRGWGYARPVQRSTGSGLLRPVRKG